jgi:hypothetical protein
MSLRRVLVDATRLKISKINVCVMSLTTLKFRGINKPKMLESGSLLVFDFRL